MNKLEQGEEVVIDGFPGTVIKAPDSGVETTHAPETPGGWQGDVFE